MNIPTFETERLLLRELRAEDLDDYARMSADADTMQYLGSGQTLDRAGAWRTLAFFLGHWQMNGFGMWAVVEKASGRFLGRVGFHQPEGWHGFEIGWMIDREQWGRGFATEAAKACLGRAVPDYNQRHVISLIHPDNAPSIRVAEKIGESPEGEITLNDVRVLVYGIELRE